MAPVRVLHVAQPTVGGVPAVIARMLDAQRAQGWQPAVACPDDGALPGLARERGVPHHLWRARREPGPSAVPETLALARVVGVVGPDIVHLHSSKAGLAGRLAIRGRRPTVFQPHAWSFFALHDPLRRPAQAWERFAVRWTDALVCVSDDERRAGEHAGIAGPWRIVRNGVDLGTSAEAAAEGRGAARRALGLPDGPLAVCVGRLQRAKGQDRLLDAWRLVRAAVPGATLAVVGDGPDRKALEAAAGPSVRFAGTRDDALRWLVAADVVALPSRWEAASLVLLEAMACGRSVVAFGVPGVLEALGPAAGAVVACQDIHAFARELAARLRDRAWADREGGAGRRRATERFDLRLTQRACVAVYEDLLAPATRRAATHRPAPVPPPRGARRWRPAGPRP
jgi:glycosyltransferase involved in cell wall biosynthesis